MASDWGTMDAPQRVAWTQGFLAGRAVGQLPDSVARDTIAFAQDLTQLRQGAGSRFRTRLRCMSPGWGTTTTGKTIVRIRSGGQCWT